MDHRVLRIAVFIPVVMAGLAVAMLSREGQRRRGLAFVLGWLLPGSGHALLGKWKKGVFFFALLGATYFFGQWIVGFRPVSFEDNPFYYVGQFGCGAMYVVAQFFSSEKAFPREGFPPLSWFDPGLLYVCVAGLLNLVVVMNVLDVKREDPAPATPVPAPPAQAASETTG